MKAKTMLALSAAAVSSALAVRDLRVYADASFGAVSHYLDKSGLECDAVVHLRNGTYGLVEIKLGGDTLVNEGASTLNALARTRCGCLRSARLNRGKNEVRLGAWPLGFPHLSESNAMSSGCHLRCAHMRPVSPMNHFGRFNVRS